MVLYRLKFILHARPDKLGFYPIYLRLTLNRKATFKSTGRSVQKKMWDEKTQSVRSAHPTSAVINSQLNLLRQEYETRLLNSQIKGEKLTADTPKEKPLNQSNLFEYVEDYLIRSKKTKQTIKNHYKGLTKLETFNGSRKLAFEDIDPAFLSKYEKWLRENIVFRKTDEQKNYIHAIWKTLKTWFNAAKKEGITINYPFDRYDNPTYIPPEKDYLTLDELKLIEDFADTTTDKFLKQTAVYFLFGAFSGFRISDWYLFNPEKHLKNGKIRLRPAKTKNKWVEMVISKPLARNLERMQLIKLDVLEPTINRRLKIIAGKLEIKKHVTSHSARHSFAVSICLGNGLSSETTAELMGINLETFINNYSQVTQAKIDTEALQAWKDLK